MGEVWLPLTGIRVIDVTDESAVFGTRLLADLGAEVIRVEPADGGRLRARAPFLRDTPGVERSLHHLHMNANKQSTVGDDHTVRALLPTADVLVETAADGRWDDCREANPHLVHVRVTPFGPDGAWRDWRSADLVAEATSGLTWVCGPPDGTPTQSGADQGHKLVGLEVAAAALIAVHGRDATPGAAGCRVDISMQEAVAMAAVQTANPSTWVFNGLIPGRPGLTAVFACNDGKFTTINVWPKNDEVFGEWVEANGIGDAETRAALRDPAQRGRAAADLVTELCISLPRSELLAQAWARDIQALPVNDLPDLATNEQLAVVDQFLTVDATDTVGEHLGFMRSAAAVALGTTTPLRRAPALGEHTAAVEAMRATVPARPAPTAPFPDQPLAGVRVLDFCWVLAGPLGTRVLSNFGAEVIRVEALDRLLPDALPPGTTDIDLGAFHNLVDPGKRSVTIDPRTPQGRELLLALAALSDACTNNFRPGAIEKLGFGYDVLRARNPAIVMAHMPGCGRTGPWSTLPTLGNMVMAASGISSLTGSPWEPPRGLGVAYPDFTSPLLLVATVLAGVREARATGRGRELELNQLAATNSLIGVEWMQFVADGVAPPPRNNRDPNYCPHGIYPASGADEWIAIAVEGDEEWARAAAALGLDESVVDDPRFADHDSRKANEDALDELVAARTATVDKWELAERLQDVGIAAGPVEHLRDTWERDPQLSRYHYQRVRQPHAPEHEIPVDGEPITIDGRRLALRPAPRHGADNEYVLGELLGLTAAEIGRLYDDGVVLRPPRT